MKFPHALVLLVLVIASANSSEKVNADVVNFNLNDVFGHARDSLPDTAVYESSLNAGFTTTVDLATATGEALLAGASIDFQIVAATNDQMLFKSNSEGYYSVDSGTTGPNSDRDNVETGESWTFNFSNYVAPTDTDYFITSFDLTSVWFQGTTTSTNGFSIGSNTYGIITTGQSGGTEFAVNEDLFSPGGGASFVFENLAPTELRIGSELANLQLDFSAVPEPGSAMVLGLGGLALFLRRRKSN